MREELLVKLIDKIAPRFSGSVAELRDAIDAVIYDYDIQPRERGLAVLDDMTDKIELYLASKRLDGLSELTLKNYRTHLLRLAAFLHKDVVNVDIMDLRRFLAVYSSQKKVRNSTMANVVGVLKAFFSWLVDNDYTIKNPTRALKATKVEKRLRKALTSEELERMRDACRSPREQAILELFFASGCRLAEIQKLNVGDIDWIGMSIRVIGKGNKERVVYFTPKAKLFLRKYLATRKIVGNADPLFIAAKIPHNRLSGKSLEIEIKKIAARAGFEKSIFPHLIRHTTATLALKAGTSITTIQSLLGHSSLNTTMVYAEHNQEAVKYEYTRHMA